MTTLGTRHGHCSFWVGATNSENSGMGCRGVSVRQATGGIRPWPDRARGHYQAQRDLSHLRRQERGQDDNGCISAWQGDGRVGTIRREPTWVELTLGPGWGPASIHFVRRMAATESRPDRLRASSPTMGREQGRLGDHRIERARGPCSCARQSWVRLGMLAQRRRPD